MGKYIVIHRETNEVCKRCKLPETALGFIYGAEEDFVVLKEMSVEDLMKEWDENTGIN